METDLQTAENWQQEKTELEAELARFKGYCALKDEKIRKLLATRKRLGLLIQYQQRFISGHGEKCARTAEHLCSTRRENGALQAKITELKGELESVRDKNCMGEMQRYIKIIERWKGQVLPLRRKVNELTGELSTLKRQSGTTEGVQSGA